jgi:hypothetical protein
MMEASVPKRPQTAPVQYGKSRRRRQSLYEPLITIPDPAEIAITDIPATLAMLAATQVALTARLMAEPAATITATAPTAYDLDADAIARRLGRSRRWVFRNAQRLPFVRRISRKTIRGDESGLNRWIASRR